MATPNADSAPLPRSLRLVWEWSLALSALALLTTWAKIHAGSLEGLWNPLVDPAFCDLMEFPPVFRSLHTAQFFAWVGHSRFSYPPLGAVLYAVLYGSGHPVALYLGTAAAWLTTCLWAVRRKLLAMKIGRITATFFPLTLVLVSFPIMGMLHQGNIELALWIFTALGAWAYLQGSDDTAALLWGLAAAVKLYPIILLILLLPRRRWRALALGIATFVASSLLSLYWIGPTIGVAYRGLSESIFGYQGGRILQWTMHEILPNHSVFSFAKLAMMTSGLPVAKLMRPYYLAGMGIMGLAFFARLWKMPALNQLLAITVFMLAFPPISYYYTLVNLYAPFLALLFLALRAEQTAVKISGLQTTLLLFVPLFAPFTLFTFPRVFLFGGLIHAVLLVALFLCALQYPFAEPTKDSAV